jgi:hypothetical protein
LGWREVRTGSRRIRLHRLDFVRSRSIADG